METSENITNITKALFIFDAEVGKVKTGSINPFFKNKYASLPDILSAIKEPLQKAGLTVKQFPENGDGLTTMIIHAETGEFISSNYQMKAVKDDPQQQGSRITYQRRYAIGAVLGLNIDEDDDGNKASEPGKKTTKETPKTDEPQKPWLKEIQFKAALDRINKGEKDILSKLKESFIMKKDYFSQLVNAEKNYENNEPGRNDINELEDEEPPF